MEGENGHGLLSFQDAKSLAIVAEWEQTVAATLKNYYFSNRAWSGSPEKGAHAGLQLGGLLP